MEKLSKEASKNHSYNKELLEVLQLIFPYEKFEKSPRAEIDRVENMLAHLDESSKKASKKWQTYLEKFLRELELFFKKQIDQANEKKNSYNKLLEDSFIADRDISKIEYHSFLKVFSALPNAALSEDSPKFESTSKLSGDLHKNSDLDNKIAQNDSGFEDAIVVEDNTKKQDNPESSFEDPEVQVHTSLPKNIYPRPKKPDLSILAEDAEILEEIRNPETKNDIDQDSEKEFEKDLEYEVEINNASEKKNEINDATKKDDNPAVEESEKEPEKNIEQPKHKKGGGFLKRFASGLWENRKRILTSFATGGILRYVAGPAYAAIVPAVSFGKATYSAAVEDYKKTLDKLIISKENDLRKQYESHNPEEKQDLKDFFTSKYGELKKHFAEKESHLNKLSLEFNEQKTALLDAERDFEIHKEKYEKENTDDTKQKYEDANTLLEKVRKNFEFIKSERDSSLDIFSSIQENLKNFDEINELLKKKSKAGALSREFWTYARDNRKEIWKNHKNEIGKKTIISAISAIAGSVATSFIPENLLDDMFKTNVVPQNNVSSESLENNISSDQQVDIEAQKNLQDSVINNDSTKAGVVLEETNSAEISAEENNTSEAEKEASENLAVALDIRIENFIKHAEEVRGENLQKWALNGLKMYSEDAPKSKTAWQILELVHGSTDPALIKEASDLVQDLGLDSKHAAMNVADSNEAYSHALKGEWDKAVENWAEPAQRGHSVSRRHLKEIVDHNLGGLGQQAASYL